ncbi:MAG: M48 family metalloprotease [Leptospiraceae bacterium]|nr:M48 family metalloprotease [Leptospiraceae bacterium]
MKRAGAGLAIILTGCLLVFGIARFGGKQALPPTAAPLFELLGKPIKTADVALTKVLPIDDVDEKELGDAIAARYISYGEDSPERLYVQDLVTNLTKNNGKGFQYRAYIMEYPEPNAMAMPGGVLFVTRGLLDMVQSESELVAVLGHEIGHVELSHCMDMVRFELLNRKMHGRMLGELADVAVQVMLTPAFSKTQEADADAYGFQVLVREKYDPFGMERTFDRLADLSSSEQRQSMDPVSEYFMSHPYSHLRARKYESEAKLVELDRFYLGEMNLKDLTSRYKEEYPKEWKEKESNDSDN